MNEQDQVNVPTPLAGSWWQKLVKFVIAIVAGGTGKIAIPVGVQLPAFKITADIGIFGRSEIATLSASGNDDNIQLAVAPATS